MELNNHGDLKAQNYFCDSHKKVTLTRTLSRYQPRMRGATKEKNTYTIFFSKAT